MGNLIRIIVMNMVDLRSDTLTQPSAEMREAICNTQVGDDVFGEDPTINRLQEMMADISGKEAALYVASGTMGNQICIKAHTQPGNEIIVERHSHLFNYECGSPALLSHVQVLPIEGLRGSISVEQIKEVIRPENVHHPQTTLICIENTHNRSGGSIFPYHEIEKISSFSKENQIKVHLDGARLWNASVATGIPIKTYCDLVDSISLCFSKGLGAPVGSIIVGSQEFIEQARYYRKAFGGGMRQAGILAAAAIYAINNNIERLEEDHRRARVLADFITTLPGVEIDKESLQTNIVIFNVKNSGLSGQQVVDHLHKKGIKMLTFAGTKMRAVTHMQISDQDIQSAISALNAVLNSKII
jgi:threonine aldolase